MHLKNVQPPRLKQIGDLGVKSSPLLVHLGRGTDESLEISGHVAIVRSESGLADDQAIEFSDARIAGSDLSGLHIRSAIRTAFIDCKLVGTVFDSGAVVDVLFTGSRLDTTSFRFCKVKRTKFEACSLVAPDFFHAELSDIAIVGGNFQGLGFDGAVINNVDLRGSDLEIGSPATIKGAIISAEQAIGLSQEMAQELGIIIAD